MKRKAANPKGFTQGSSLSWARQCKGLGLILALGGGLAACDPGVAPGTIGHVQGFAGVAASDEPQSVLVARDILSSGGSAVDAAVAMYFTMAVTLPSRVGPAGYGACVVHNPGTKLTEAVVFIPPQPAAVTAPRAFFALQAKYGHLKWGALIGPAESIARFGAPMSRAMAQDIALAGDRLAADPAMKEIFTKPDGSLLGEGDVIKNVGLASFLVGLRARGPADLYAGNQAKELSAAATAAGYPLSMDQLRAVQVPLVKPLGVKFGNLTAFFPPEPAGAGSEEARLFKQAVDKQPVSVASSTEPAAGAGFMVADRDGQAVVCSTSLGGLFGLYKTVPGTGLILAKEPVPKTSLGPMMVVAHNVQEFRYAMTSAGGEMGEAGLIQAAQKALLDDVPLQDAVRSVAGKRLVTIGCPQGLPPKPESCQVAVDPEGFGYGAGVGLRGKD